MCWLFFIKKPNMIPEWIQKIQNALKKEYFHIEKRNDLTDDEKISQIIKHTAAACSTVAVQPFPFADIFLLTPIQIIMAQKISDVRKKPLSEKKPKDLIKEIIGVVGLGYLAQQSVIALYKIGLPFLSGFWTLPLVYGLTCGIGRAVDFYFTNELEEEDLKLYKKELTKIFKEEIKKRKKESREEIKKLVEKYKKTLR